MQSAHGYLDRAERDALLALGATGRQLWAPFVNVATSGNMADISQALDAALDGAPQRQRQTATDRESFARDVARAALVVDELSDADSRAFRWVGGVERNLLHIVDFVASGRYDNLSQYVTGHLPAVGWERIRQSRLRDNTPWRQAGNQPIDALALSRYIKGQVVGVYRRTPIVRSYTASQLGAMNEVLHWLDKTGFAVERRCVKRRETPSTMIYECDASGIVGGTSVRAIFNTFLGATRKRKDEVRYAEASDEVARCRLPELTTPDTHRFVITGSDTNTATAIPGAPVINIDEFDRHMPRCLHASQEWADTMSHCDVRVCRRCGESTAVRYRIDAPELRRNEAQLRRVAERDLPFFRAAAVIRGEKRPELDEVINREFHRRGSITTDGLAGALRRR